MNKSMSSKVVAFLLVLNGIAYYSTVFITYIHYNYYTAFQEAVGMTHGEIGLIGTLSGTATLIAFILSGVLADKIKTKVLLLSAYVAAIASLLLYSFMPKYDVLLILQPVVVLITISLYWCSAAKYVRSLKGPEYEARLYGFHYAFAGIGGSILGFIGAGLITSLGSEVGLKYVFIMNAAYLVICIVLNIFVYKPEQIETSPEDQFRMKYIGDILKMPLFWLACLVYFTIYCTGLALSYFSPLMESSYNAPIFIVSILGTIRIYMARAIFAPLGGLAIDKMGSSQKVLSCLFFVSIVAVVLCLVFPRTESFFIVGMIAFLLFCVAYNMTVPAWFAPLTEIQIPDKMRGTATGLYTAIGCSTDAFGYVICGNLLDAKGDAGYTIIFAVVGVMFVIGLIASIITLKKVNALKASQA